MQFCDFKNALGNLSQGRDLGSKDVSQGCRGLTVQEAQTSAVRQRPLLPGSAFGWDFSLGSHNGGAKSKAAMRAIQPHHVPPTCIPGGPPQPATPSLFMFETGAGLPSPWGCHGDGGNEHTKPSPGSGTMRLSTTEASNARRWRF